ncbi:MAG: ABC transporter permease, partial [Clostridiales bacterium]|nr:ABC transporter permease [Clostridiales bacterium]
MNLRYVLKRILNACIILFIVITLNFLLPRLIFSDPAEPLLHGIPDTDTVLRDLIRKEYGLDGSIFQQYWAYLVKMVQFDYGTSYAYNQPVFEVMFSKIPWSLILTLTSMIISVTLGILIGARAAKNRGKRPDRALLAVATFTTALPAFWIAMMLMVVVCFIFQ